MEENVICEILSNALVTVDLNKGYMKPFQLECIQRRIVAVCLS